MWAEQVVSLLKCGDTGQRDGGGVESVIRASRWTVTAGVNRRQNSAVTTRLFEDRHLARLVHR